MPYLDTRDEFRGGPEELWVKETATATPIALGDLVYYDANGTVIQCGVTGGFNLNTAILGIAQQAGTGVAGTSIRVRVISPDDRFLMNIFHTTAASAITAQTQLGTPAIYAIRRDPAALPTGTTNRWVVDLTTTPESAGVALGRVQILGFYLGPDSVPLAVTGAYAQPAIGDIYAPVIVRFLPLVVSSDGALHTYVLQGA
jgi:hypothetical protein